jgi:hypothetical protein
MGRIPVSGAAGNVGNERRAVSQRTLRIRL